MFITFEDDKSVDQEEVKPTGGGARSERQEPSEWRYIDTSYTGFVKAGNIELRPHWNGPVTVEEIRAVVRMASAAPALYEVLRKTGRAASDGSGLCWCGDDPRVHGHDPKCESARAALCSSRWSTESGEEINESAS